MLQEILQNVGKLIGIAVLYIPPVRHCKAPIKAWRSPLVGGSCMLREKASTGITWNTATKKKRKPSFIWIYKWLPFSPPQTAHIIATPTNFLFVGRDSQSLKALFLLEPDFPNQMLSTAQHQISPLSIDLLKHITAYPGLVEAAPKCPQNPWSPPPIASPAEFHRGFVHCVRARICAREWKDLCILQCEGVRVRSVGVRKHLLYLPRTNENRWI